MPIRPEMRDKYPKDWKLISHEVREAAGWRCVGSNAYPGCRAKHGFEHPSTGSIVVLTVAHLDHDPTNCDRDNLRAWCQRCHNKYDAPHRREGMRQRARAEMAIGDLF